MNFSNVKPQNEIPRLPQLVRVTVEHREEVLPKNVEGPGGASFH